MRARARHALTLICAGAATMVWGATVLSDTATRLEWSEPGRDFGGFSGLVISADGRSFYAVSDRGTLWHARLTRDGEGRVAGVRADWHERLLDNFGAPVNDFKADAEALSQGADGSLIIAYEGYARITKVTPPDPKPVTLNRWDRFRDLWGNEGMEGVVELPGGRVLAILETATDGAYATVVGHKGAWTDGPDIPGAGDFAATDATIGPDRQLYLLERRFGYLSGFESRIRRFSDPGGPFDAGEVVFQSAPGRFGDLEGISLWRDSLGHTHVIMISDNNFLPLEPTELVEFTLSN